MKRRKIFISKDAPQDKNILWLKIGDNPQLLMFLNDDWIPIGTVIEEKYLNFIYERLKGLIDKYKESDNKNFNAFKIEVSNILKSYDDVLKSYDDTLKSYDKKIDDLSKILDEGLVDKVKTLFGYIGINYDETDPQFTADLASTLRQIDEAIGSLEDGIKDVEKNINTRIDEEIVERIQTIFNYLGFDYEERDPEYTSLTATLNQMNEAIDSCVSELMDADEANTLYNEIVEEIESDYEDENSEWVPEPLNKEEDNEQSSI